MRKHKKNSAKGVHRLLQFMNKIFFEVPRFPDFLFCDFFFSLGEADATTNKVNTILTNYCKPKRMIGYKFSGWGFWRAASASHYRCKSGK